MSCHSLLLFFGNGIISCNVNTNNPNILIPTSPKTPNSLLISHNPVFSNVVHYYSKKNIMINSNKTSNQLQCLCTQSSSGVLTEPPPTTVANGWAAFAEKVSGEWDGFGTDFTGQGEAIELPESVVPEAYREWEVKVFDWQTQCPTLATLSPSSFNYKLIRLLPTVGCEADAATRHSIDERNAADPRCAAFAYHPSTGSYVAAWDLHASAEIIVFELEHCLIDPRDRESRVRIIQVLRLVKDGDGDDGGSERRKVELRSVKVFREQWYGPFRNGEQLGGCAIRDSAFASTPPLEASKVVGVWEGPASTTTFFTKNAIQELKEEGVRRAVRDEANLVLLPKQLWCCLKDTEVGGETCCEAGWLLDTGTAITSNCIFSQTGDLKEIAITYQHSTPESEQQ